MYASKRQQRYFNANRAKLEAQGVDVDEWNKATKGHYGQLPEIAPKKKTSRKASAHHGH